MVTWSRLSPWQQSMRLNSVIGILLLSANGGRAVHSQSAQLPIKESFCARCGFQVDSLGRIGEKHQLASSALGAAANRTSRGCTVSGRALCSDLRSSRAIEVPHHNAANFPGNAGCVGCRGSGGPPSPVCDHPINEGFPARGRQCSPAWLAKLGHAHKR